MTERSGTERAWLAGGVLAVGLAVLIAWFMVVHPELSKASSTRDEVTSTQDSNLFLQRRVSDLQSQSRQLNSLAGQLRAASAALPSTAGIDEFTRQLSSYAHDGHVAITSITVGSPELAGSSDAAPVTPSAASTSAATEPGTGTAATTGTATTAVVGQTYSIEVTVVSSGSATDQQSFLHKLQHGPRAAFVTSAALAPPQSGSSSSATLTTQLEVFVQPQSPQDQAALQKLLDAAAAN
jgi:hypothetical protein